MPLISDVARRLDNPRDGAVEAPPPFVALDEHHKPVPIPSLTSETRDELRRHENARLCVAARKELVAKLNRKRGNASQSERTGAST